MGTRHITVLGTSDLHGDLLGYCYEDGRDSGNRGIARIASYVEKVRKENPATLLIDAGDAFDSKNGFPVIDAMNSMRYDAMTLGNHEAEMKEEAASILRKASFPILAANARNADGSLLTGHGWIIREINGIRIAVIGVVTPYAENGTLTFEPAPEAVRKAIGEIGEKADAVIVSAHMGMYPEFDEEGGADSALMILRDNPGISVLQAAHNHIVVRERCSGTVVGGVRDRGRDIARFDLWFGSDGSVVRSTVEIVDMTGISPSEKTERLESVRKAHEEALLTGRKKEDNVRGEVIGHTTACFLPPDRTPGVPSCRIMPTPLVHLINQVQMEASGADVSATALFSAAADLPAGDVTEEDIAAVYRLDNRLYRVNVTGKELIAYMEWSAACYRQWHEGDAEISFNPDRPVFLQDMFDGLEYEIDISQPEGRRIRNVTRNGKRLEDDDRLSLAVNSFRYASLLKGEGIIEGRKDWECGATIRELLIRHFRNKGKISPDTSLNWRITGAGGKGVPTLR